MLFVNRTPFVPMVVPARDKEDRDFWVIVVKGTFRLAGAKEAVIDEAQEPIHLADQFHGEDTSSVRVEDDLAPFKPRADVLIDGTARAPAGRAAGSWLVRARVGRVEKTLRVTGARRWRKNVIGHSLTEPEPCLEVPLRYDRAFGGTWRTQGGGTSVCEENPIGLGFVAQGERAEDDVSAPQIEDPLAPLETLGSRAKPEGMGPIARAWLPRRKLAGTPDEKWRSERWPNVPIDFDDAFYNCAHPDLVYPGYPTGGEEIAIDGFGDAIRSRVPSPPLTVVAFPYPEPLVPVMDTLFIDADRARLSITWRTRVETRHGIEAIGLMLDETRGRRVQR
jgi:hypothetical protein